MTQTGDYPGEMRKPWGFDDQTAEDLLAGRSAVDADLEGIQAFLGDLRRFADGESPRPNAVLAEVLAAGVPQDERISTAPTPQRRPAHTPRKRRMVAELLTGLAAKIGIGIATAATAVAGAGVAGALPEPANDAVRGVLTAITGQEFDAADDHESDDPAATGGEVADDQTDEAQNRVDGHATADEAKARALENRSNDGPEAAENGQPENPGSEGRDRATEHADESNRIPAEVGPGHDNRPEDTPGPADQRGEENRRDADFRPNDDDTTPPASDAERGGPPSDAGTQGDSRSTDARDGRVPQDVGAGADDPPGRR